MKRFCIFMERMYVLMKHECFRGSSDDSNGYEKPGRAGQMAERLAAGRDEKISDEEKRRMNDGFVQVYSKGWARMRELLRETKSQAPLLLYTFIAEHMDADGGVVVADQETICEAIG